MTIDKIPELLVAMETHYAAVRLMVNVGVLIRRSNLLMTFTSNTYDRTCVLLIKVLYKSVFFCGCRLFAV